MPKAKLERNRLSEVRVESVGKFVEAVCQIRDSWIVSTDYFDPWFRGQRDVKWALEPNIFRFDLLTAEDEIRAEFARRASQYMTETPPEDDWGWYILMQHYGAPTRLLDWTDSALVALFFALNSESMIADDSSDSVVWMLDPWWLNREVLQHDAILLPDFDGAKPYLRSPYDSVDRHGQTRIQPTRPVAIDPPFLARRVAVQRSHFTVFGNARDGLMKLALSPGARLIQIVIPKKKKERMRADLLTSGISDTSIYPDLHGLAGELTRYHIGRWPPD